mgnify:CR=1 FL=1
MKNKKTIRNFLIFILLIIITFIVLFKDQDINEIYNIFLNVDIKYILLGILAMSLYFILEGLNLKQIINRFGKKTSLIKMIKFALIGFFFSGITPAASGGQPMEIYYMHKEDISVAYSTVALLVILISFQIITITCGIVGAIINYKLLANGLIYLFIIGLSLNIIALTTMLVCLFSSNLAKTIVNFFIKILEKLKIKNINEMQAKIDITLESYNESSHYIKKHKDIFFKSMLIMFFQVMAYYSIPFLVYKAFGLNTYNLINIMTIQAVVFSSVSSIPIPGTVGISEGTYLIIYKNIYGSTYLSSATILNRTINFYLFVIIGLFITVYNLLKSKKENSKENV